MGEGHALATRAVTQDRLQDWIANRIKAKRVVILLDTCESGALIGGHTAPRVGVSRAEAGVGRLHEATGRPVLTAAAAGKVAVEGYKGHGVFSYALLDALTNGDTNQNGVLELSELASHVQVLTPKIAQTVTILVRNPSCKSRVSARAGRILRWWGAWPHTLCLLERSKPYFPLLARAGNHLTEAAEGFASALARRVDGRSRGASVSGLHRRERVHVHHSVSVLVGRSRKSSRHHGCCRGECIE